MAQTQYFEHELALSSTGSKFPAKLAYWTFGSSSSPAVLLPTCYSGTLESTLPFLYDEKAHDGPIFPPSKYFVIVTGLLSGGESSSPSNAPEPYKTTNFPKVTYEDNIRLQHALCENLGVKKLFAYIGFSMGGQQAYHVSVLYPKFVENMVCIAGSAKTSAHNWCFLEGPKNALSQSIDYQDGHYTTPALRGTRAFSRVYSAWALSPEWFSQKQWETTGAKSLEEYLEKGWSGGTENDANDLLWLLATWQDGDITKYSPEDQGDLSKTLGRIEARCLIMPSRTDQYFRVEESEEEVKHLKHGELKVIDTVWGHIAGGGGGTKEDTDFMIKSIKEFMKI